VESAGSCPALRSAWGWARTTLANIIANELGRRSADLGAYFAAQGDLTAILTNLRDRQVLFIDEVHRLQPALEEILYSALEDYKLDIMIGQGHSADAHDGCEARSRLLERRRGRAVVGSLRSRFGLLLR